jgi:hypothetical protein
MNKSQRQQLFIAAIESVANLVAACVQLGVPTSDIQRVGVRIKRLAAEEGIDLDALLDAEHDQMSAMVDALLKGDSSALVDAILPKKTR